MTKEEIRNRIEELKREKNAVILAHYYTTKEVQEIADFLGDSLALSVKARDIEAPIILFAGVNFMAETAKVLSPNKKVLIPVPEAGCSLAESCEAEALARLKAQHPEAKVVVHPECKADLVAVADYVGSTAGILDYCKESDAEEFIVVTESGILVEMEKRLPAKRFIPAPTIGSEGGCNECHYMKMVTLENILSTLENESPEVTIDEPTRKAAEQSILNMVAIK